MLSQPQGQCRISIYIYIYIAYIKIYTHYIYIIFALGADVACFFIALLDQYLGTLSHNVGVGCHLFGIS